MGPTPSGINNIPPTIPHDPTVLRRVPAWRVAAAYMAFGLGWILVSDLALIVTDIHTESSLWVSIFKGCIFVALSAAGLFWLVRHEFAALKRATDLLRAVVEGTNDAVAVKDRDGRYLLVNRAAARLMGKPSGEVLGRDDDALFPPDQASAMTAVDQLVMATGTAQARERDLGGDEEPSRTYHSATVPYRDNQGAVLGVIEVARDISDRKRAEEELRESEERYRRLIHVLPSAVFIHSQGKIVFCNPALLTLTGANSPDQLLGRTAADLFHPDDHPYIRHWAVSLYNTGAPMPARQVRVLRVDGRPILASAVATAIRDRGADAVLVALNDLTEQERAAGLLRAVLGSVGDAILTIDEAGVVQSTSPAVEKLFGYTEAEVLHQNVRLLMPEPHRAAHDDYLSAYLRGGPPRIIGTTGRQLEARRKDGSTFPVELTVTELRLEGRRHFTGVVRDITARKRLEEQYRQAQKMEAVGQLAGGVAHDFNNMLTVINGHAEFLLLSLPAESETRGHAVSILEAGERAAGLTGRLLSFARKGVNEPKIVNVNEVIEQVGKLLRRLIGEDIALTMTLDDSMGRVMIDPGQLEQVLMNLAVNARDAMPTGGTLTIETRPVRFGPADLLPSPDLAPGRYVRMRVSDTGCGMTAEVMDRIFEPFFTTKEAGRGTGLGLATVYGVVTHAGGHVGVESVVGRGTTFTVLLPETEAGLQTVRRPGAQPLGAPRGAETILLAEDEQAVRRLAELTLEVQGYQVLACPHGAAALALARNHPGPIHLLLTDVVMPGMSGRDLAEAVRLLRPEVKVLYMSGYAPEALLRHGVEAAGDLLLQKPFSPMVLAQKVRGLLDGTARG